MREAAGRHISFTTFDGRKHWSLAMTAFLLRHRREGRTLRWIARALGMPFEQVRRKAVALGLVLRTAYQKRVPAVRLEDEPPPLGAPRELVADGRCRWIGGDVSCPDWRMCGHTARPGSAWCAHHYGRVFWLAPTQLADAA